MIITNYAIRFRQAVFVGLILLLWAGADAYRSLPREQFPDVTIPHIFVNAPYKGTSPAEIERLITIPLETKLNGVSGVKDMRSTSGENLCFVDIEFMAGTDIQVAQQRVKDKVDLARPDLPSDLDEPVVEGMNFSSDIPILIFAISGDPDLSRLKNLAETMKDQIENIHDVRDVTLSGGQEREIRVELDLHRLAEYGIPLSTVLRCIGNENVTVTAGNLEVKGDKYLVRVPGEFSTAAAMRDVAVASVKGSPVFLHDVADIRDTFKDVDSRSRVNGEACVSISIKKRDGANVVECIRSVKKILKGTAWPDGVKPTMVFDQSEEIDRQIQDLENNIVSGFILVVLVLLLFMGIRNSVLVGLAIPTSLLLAFIVMRSVGATLNMMTLFSLVLVIGMLVDNAIVIVENSYRLRCEDLSRTEAARQGASEVAWPVTTSTLTTVAAFLPLMYWPGMIGKFMWFLPWTVIVTLMASLVVGLLVNPSVCSVMIERRKRVITSETRPSRFVMGYERLLRTALRHRVLALALGMAVLVLSLAAYVRFGAGVTLFPQVDPRNADIIVRFPQGTPLDRVDAAAREVEKALPQTPDIKFILTTSGVGGGVDRFMSNAASGTHRAGINIQFVAFEKRQRPSMEWIEAIRASLPRIPDAEITVSRERMGPPVGAPVSVEIAGDDFEVLSGVAAEVKAKLEPIPGLVDLRSDFEDALPELQFRVDRTRAALYGLDAQSIGSFLRMAIFGLQAGTIRAGRNEYDITVRLPEGQRDTLALLKGARIPTATGEAVPLTSIGEVVYTGGSGEIQRKNQKRVITLNGNDHQRGLDQILADVKARLSEISVPAGYSVLLRGENEEQKEASAFLTRAFFIASGLILIILVIQFNSVLLPAIIFTSVIMSMNGVATGLLATGEKFSVIMTGLGVISLAGVVVNNAIVLIDCINLLRSEGMNTQEAIVQAGRRRLRPVLLTAATTILGLIPMAAGWGLEIHSFPWTFTAGAESSIWWAPMAISVIFGLGFATVLTLVLVPAMYSLSYQWIQKFAPRQKAHD